MVHPLHALHDLVLVLRWGAVAHVVHHLVPHLRVNVLRQLEQPRPELRDVLEHSAGAHLLGSLQSHHRVLTLSQLDDLVHILGVSDALEVVRLHLLGVHRRPGSFVLVRVGVRVGAVLLLFLVLFLIGLLGRFPEALPL